MSSDEVQRISRIGGATRLTGLIGWPVSHSLSPAMHNAAAADLGVDLAYLPLPVRPADLAGAIDGLVALGFLGVNVTIPHKEQVITLLDQVDPPARVIGAVNTIVIGRPQSPTANTQSLFLHRSLSPIPDPSSRSGRSATSQIPDPRLSGFNTDWSGFLADLAEIGIEAAGRECLVLGAGGSARAVVYTLASLGARVHVFARRIDQVLQLAYDLNTAGYSEIEAHSWQKLETIARQCPLTALIINTTPLGMAPKEDLSPWPDGLPFPAEAIVYDLVYNPAETRLVGQARAAGCRAYNGLGMLLQQGAQAFELWTGRRPRVEVMARAIGRSYQ